ncbi:hypothetical protein [Spirosoma radiotolerans]|uniref:hypothetical protein n=1 Tax=Spirosoma radiotolerans TaxID=1379870 RepID=UPI001D128B3B|nr:hypothetical protein [Spirosoma radiotolerans]
MMPLSIRKPLRIQDKQGSFSLHHSSTQFIIPYFYHSLPFMPAYLVNPFAGINSCL